MYTNWYIYPPRLRIQRMAFNAEICWWVVFLYAFNVYLVLMIFVTSCLQFTLFKITHRNPWFLRWRAWLSSEITLGGWCLSAFIWTMVFARQARFVRWRTSLNKEMLVVGVGGGKATYPATHSPTNQHPPTCTHLHTMQGRLTVTAILRIMVKRTHPLTTRSPTNNTYPPTNNHPAMILK